MPYNNVEIKQMADAIKAANQEAQAYINSPDGGTCNFDHAYIRVPRMRQATAAHIAQLSGVELSLHTYSGHGRILEVHGGLSGQGARRTKMAETMRDSLKASGFDASMWYQMD